MSIIPSSNHYPVKSNHLRRENNAVSTRELRKREEFWVNPPLKRQELQEQRFASEEAYHPSMLARRNIVTSSSIHRSTSPVNSDGPLETDRSFPTSSKETSSLEEMLSDTQTKLSNLLEISVDLILKFPDLERKYHALEKFGERCLEHKDLNSSQKTALKIFDAFSEDIKKLYELCALDNFDLQKLAVNNFRAIRFLVTLTNSWVKLTKKYSLWGSLNITEKMSKAAVDCQDYINHIGLIREKLEEIESIYTTINRPQEALDIVNLAFEFSQASTFLVMATDARLLSNVWHSV